MFLYVPVCFDPFQLVDARSLAVDNFQSTFLVNQSALNMIKLDKVG